MSKEPAPVRPRRPGRADRPAVDARRRHTHEEEAVETSVASGQCPITGFMVESHAGTLRNWQSQISPFSDVTAGFALKSENGDSESH